MPDGGEIGSTQMLAKTRRLWRALEVRLADEERQRCLSEQIKAELQGGREQNRMERERLASFVIEMKQRASSTAIRADKYERDLAARQASRDLAFKNACHACARYAALKAEALWMRRCIETLPDKRDLLSQKSNEAKVLQLKAMKASFPNNIAVQTFDQKYYDSLATDELRTRFLKCLDSGRENGDSCMGCYVNMPDDYETFVGFFKPALEKYHNVNLDETKHINSWELTGIRGLPSDGILDISKIGLPALSMRVRTARNLKKFPLLGCMNKQDRCNMELAMCLVFDHLKQNLEFGGRYVSITPGHKDFIDDSEYQKLVDDHIMFKDKAEDVYLTSAGIAADWPYGRGSYISEDRGLIIWVGEEDHLRIITMQIGTILNHVFDRMKAAINVVEKLIDGGCAYSPAFGVVTSCPTNVGTGMRASVHIQLPNLMVDGTDAKAKQICIPLGLSVRGLGGEHTPIGKDGTVDISLNARLCISEAEIVTALYIGLSKLKVAEDHARSATNDEKVKQLVEMKPTSPNNIAVQTFDPNYYNSLKNDDDKTRFLKCLDCGRENSDAHMGCYVNMPDDYDTFIGFFKPAVEKYHNVNLVAMKHISNWNLKDVEGLPGDGVLDLTRLGLPKLSMGVWIARNLKKYPMPASMTKQDRCNMELALAALFDHFKQDNLLAGRYVSITPGHKDFIEFAEYKQLVDDHIMFDDMNDDVYLTSAGIAADWPYGRGSYISEDKNLIVWVGEEDHLRIITMQRESVLNVVFDRLRAAVEIVEMFVDGGCAHSPTFGAVTSCPTNVGTGMHASVHVQLPKLTVDGSDNKVMEICEPLGLSSRGLGDERTTLVQDGFVDISTSVRLCVSEAEIIIALYIGLQKLKHAEDAVLII